MSSSSAGAISIICCSIFKAEVGALCAAHWPSHSVVFLNSILHIHPQQLASELTALVERERNAGKKILLIYGDCCSIMNQFETLPGVIRTEGLNCCHLLLGRDRYRQLSHEGVFFLLPEWIHRWREVFQDELGLDHENAAHLMGDMHRKLLYLDTGMIPVPFSLLQDCAAYCRLPFEVLPVSLDVLKETIEAGLNRLETCQGPCNA